MNWDEHETEAYGRDPLNWPPSHARPSLATKTKVSLLAHAWQFRFTFIFGLEARFGFNLSKCSVYHNSILLPRKWNPVSQRQVCTSVTFIQWKNQWNSVCVCLSFTTCARQQEDWSHCRKRGCGHSHSAECTTLKYNNNAIKKNK